MKKTALLLVSLMAITTQSYALTLKVATLSPDGSAWMTKMRAGASEIEAKTQKRVVFKFYTGGTMGNDRAVLNKIKIGQLQGGAVTIGSLADFYKDAQIYAMPLLFKSFRAGWYGKLWLCRSRVCLCDVKNSTYSFGS